MVIRRGELSYDILYIYAITLTTNKCQTRSEPYGETYAVRIFLLIRPCALMSAVDITNQIQRRKLATAESIRSGISQAKFSRSY